jgi:hypothetical protein
MLYMYPIHKTYKPHFFSQEKVAGQRRSYQVQAYLKNWLGYEIIVRVSSSLYYTTITKYSETQVLLANVSTKLNYQHMVLL